MAQPIWNTTAGSIGTYPSLNTMVYQLSADAVSPATAVEYKIISGSLSPGLTMDNDGLISGIPSIVTTNITSIFVVRVTDDLENIRDRTFNITVSGVVSPQFTTPSGTLSVTNDSIWIEIPVTYSNPVADNAVLIRVIQGQLPSGLEINTHGMIRGYPSPPTINVNLGSVVTPVITTSDNTVIGFSTTGFSVGRPIVFSGTVFGGVAAGQTYYVTSIIDSSTFTISTTPGGPTYALSNQVGFMTATLPNISVGQPTIQTYSFTLKLESLLGTDIQSYAITVVNQNAPSSVGGPNFPPNTRVPTILNTRPASFNISQPSVNYDYYILPPDSRGETYPPSSFADIGRITSDNYFTFRILGLDFDSNNIEYLFSDLPLGLVGNSGTGWIEGNPVISDNSINQYNFSVAVRKIANPSITTPSFNFSFTVRNDILGDIVWVTPSDLGTIFNGTVSNERVLATSDVALQYRLVSGALPPNLTLLDNGEISGVVAYQPTDVFLEPQTTTDFTFTIQAYSPTFPVVTSQKTFTLSVYQEFSQPTDTLYIKCTPSIPDRVLLNSLLDNDTLIPPAMVYRLNDPYFGKATSVVYEHAYGIFANSFDEYIAAVTRNHYWRQLTLGELKTATARNDAGEIIYEVVYSVVIDNLINPAGISVPEEIYWPRFIPLELGPWYTSETNIFTSYISSPTGQLYYTSLTPGKARVLYPNSLPNMRNRVGQVLGQDYNYNLLPKWMTSQQANGSTTGFVPAWVIAYCKPGFAETIKNNIETKWVDQIGRPNTLNTVNFKIDRFTVDKSTTFNYDTNVNPPVWTALPSASPAPVPTDSNDFYVLVPRATILPDETQYSS